MIVSSKVKIDEKSFNKKIDRAKAYLEEQKLMSNTDLSDLFTILTFFKEDKLEIVKFTR